MKKEPPNTIAPGTLIRDIPYTTNADPITCNTVVKFFKIYGSFVLAGLLVHLLRHSVPALPLLKA